LVWWLGAAGEVTQEWEAAVTDVKWVLEGLAAEAKTAKYVYFIPRCRQGTDEDTENAHLPKLLPPPLHPALPSAVVSPAIRNICQYAVLTVLA
jgi:hypothetical protein